MAGPPTHADYVLSMQTNRRQTEHELKSIRTGERTQRALLHNDSYKYDNRYIGADYTLQTGRRKSGLRSMTVKVMKRITKKSDKHDFGTDTTSLFEQSRQHKTGKKEHQELENKEAEHIRYLTHRQRELDNESRPKRFLAERTILTSSSTKTIPRSATTVIKDGLKNVLARKTSPIPAFSTADNSYAVPSPDHWPPPHVLDFDSKAQLLTHLSAGTTSTSVWPCASIPEDGPAELPATTRTDICPRDPPKRVDSDNFSADRDPPPTFRSSSPSEAGRDTTMSKLQSDVERTMRCDLCYDAIRMGDYHYACEQCDDGHRLYCEQCANSSRSCRHDLIEKQRGIRRHPTNPKWRAVGPIGCVPISSDDQTRTGVEDACSTSIPVVDKMVEEPKPDKPPVSTTSVSPVEEPITSINTTAQLLREIEVRRNEQEMKFREQTATLREQAAALHVRETQTYMMQQQLQHERIALGTQFSSTPPISRTSSCCLLQHSNVRTPDSTFQHSDTPCNIRFHCNNRSGEREDSPQADARLVSALQDIEAVANGVVTRAPTSRTTAQRTQRGYSSTSKVSKQSRSTAKSSLRRPSNGDDRDDANTGTEEESDTARPRDIGNDTKTAVQKYFACPFCKRDPVRYGPDNHREEQYRRCPIIKARDISRVKQHIKRKHHAPEHYCNRCYQQFTDSIELASHHRQATVCEIQSECPWLNVEKQKFVHTKRPSMTDHDEWYLIFNQIFPGALRPHSPFIETSPAGMFEPQLLEQFAQMLDDRLNASMDAELRPWLKSTNVREFLRSTVHQTMLELLTQSSSSDSMVQPDEVPSTCVSRATETEKFTQVYQSSSMPNAAHSRARQKIKGKKLRSEATLCSKLARERMPKPSLKIQTFDPSVGITGNKFAQKMEVLARAPIATHVLEDLRQESKDGSWRAGDDECGIKQGLPSCEEPTSALSASTRRSVSFATPLRTQTPCQQQSHVFPSMSHPPGAFGHCNIQAPSTWDLSGQQNWRVNNDHAQPFQSNQLTPPDSAYGTASHCRYKYKSSTSSPVAVSLVSQAHHTTHHVCNNMLSRSPDDPVNCTDSAMITAHDQVTPCQPQLLSGSLLVADMMNQDYISPGFEPNPWCDGSIYNIDTLWRSYESPKTINLRDLEPNPGNDSTMLGRKIPWTTY